MQNIVDIPQPSALLTMKASGAASDQNASLALSLHLWQECLDGLDGT